MNNKNDMQPSNADIVGRIDDIETKVDHLCAILEQANGAWFFIKLMASVGLGIATIWGLVHNWWAAT